MVAPHTSLLAVAVPTPVPTSTDDVDAFLTGPLGTFEWPDCRQGIALGDIVIVDEALFDICEGGLVKAGTDGSAPHPVISHLLGVKRTGDAGERCGRLRRELDARFGGRPGLIVIPRDGSDVYSAGISEASVASRLAGLAALLFEAYPERLAVAVRGLGQYLIYEDSGAQADGE